MSKYLIGAIIILILAGTGLGRIALRQKKQINRLESNYSATVEQFRDQAGALVARVDEKQLTIREIRQSNDSLVKQLYKAAKDMKRKDREIEQLMSIGTRTVYDSVLIPIIDTIIIRSSSDTIKKLATYRDEWLSASIIIRPDKLEVLNYECKDRIQVAVGWRKPSNIFFIRWFQRKRWDATIKSENPNTKIESVVNVKVTKKTGRK